MKTIGGAREVLPALSKWIAHKFTGHPANQMWIPKGLGITAWCECGASVPVDQKDRQTIDEHHKADYDVKEKERK